MLRWIHESPAYWDRDKQRIVGGCAHGELVHAIADLRPNDLLPSDWWRVEHHDTVVGYGWMDVTWGDAEVLLAVDPAWRGRGIGTFIIERLEIEARVRGLNYLYNEVNAAHPTFEATTRWLRARRFDALGDRLLRSVVAR